MAHTRILGVALAGVFAALAVSATGASAAPEWAACLKAEPKDTGGYADKACSVASEPGKGKYELVPGSVGKGKHIKFRGSTTQTLHIVTPHNGDIKITCKKVAGTGVPVAPNGEREVLLEFKKCRTINETPCENFARETVVTEPLSGTLAEVEGRVGTVLAPESGSYVAKFHCGVLFPTVPIIGQVFGEYTGATNTVSRVMHGHYEVGPFLGEVPDEETGQLYTPLVNPPSAGPPGHGVLYLEFHQPESDCDELPKACKTFFYPLGLEGELEAKGEALMIKT